MTLYCACMYGWYKHSIDLLVECRVLSIHMLGVLICNTFLPLSLFQESYERAVQLLRTHSVEHRRLAEGLLKYETLTAAEIKLVVAGKTVSKKL